MADYGTAGVWNHDGTALDLARLPLSPRLRARLARWCDRFGGYGRWHLSHMAVACTVAVGCGVLRALQNSKPLRVMQQHLGVDDLGLRILAVKKSMSAARNAHRDRR